MKTTPSKWSAYFCRARWFLAVMLGLGIGWAMSDSLGVAVGFAIGGSVTVAMLSRPRED
jgi:hypothetical protein